MPDEPAPVDEPTPEPDKGTDEPDWKAEAEKWKSQARKHEERAKANANATKELEQLRQASMSDLEKAVDAAKAEGRKEAIAAMGRRLVDAEVKAAAAGRKVDVDALLDGLDRSRFLTDDGEPDTKAITAWVDRIVPKPGVPDLGQGARGNGSPLDDSPRGLIRSALEANEKARPRL